MCRLVAYSGQPVFLEDFICRPQHSLVRQSLHAEEAKVPTNGDGFGVSWYGEGREPGLYRELRPAWSDENLLSLCRLVRSKLFFGHVRAATGTATTRANCHPFCHDRWMFMHNGQIGGYARIKRKLEAMLPDSFYDIRQGTTDSELLFLIALSRIAAGMTAVVAMATTLSDTKRLMEQAGITEALRFSAVLADGETIHAFRSACDDKPPTLYVCARDAATVIASEPLDGDRDCWRVVPVNSVLTVSAGSVEQQDMRCCAA